MTRKLLAFALLMVMPGSLLWSQQIMTGNYRKVFSISTPYPQFVNYTFTSGTGSTVVSSVTSPNVSLPSGDMVAVLCRSGNASNTGFTITSSISTSTFVMTLPSAYFPNVLIQVGVALTTSSSTTANFTCNSSVADSYQDMIVMWWSNPPSPISFNNPPTPIANGAGGSLVTGSFSTTARSYILVCASVGSIPVWSPGAIGGTTATLIATTDANNTASDSACEVLPTSAAQSSITAAINPSIIPQWAMVVAPINY